LLSAQFRYRGIFAFLLQLEYLPVHSFEKKNFLRASHYYSCDNINRAVRFRKVAIQDKQIFFVFNIDFYLNHACNGSHVTWLCTGFRGLCLPNRYYCKKRINDPSKTLELKVTPLQQNTSTSLKTSFPWIRFWFYCLIRLVHFSICVFSVYIQNIISL